MKPTLQDKLNLRGFDFDNEHEETSATKEANTSEIGENDVLCGRGGLSNAHVGNRQFRQIVSDHQEEYLGARKRDKIVIAQRIVSIIKDSGGRFLKREGDKWVPISDKKAQEKTSQALREGLDVRNHKLRPSKQIRRDDDSTQSGESKRKHVTLATGKVVTTANSRNLEAPSLSEEPPAPAFLPYQRQISQSEIRDACEV